METNINGAELLTNDQLHALGIVEDKKAKIEFVSGIVVSGKVEKLWSQREIIVDHVCKLQREISRPGAVPA